MQPNLIIDCPAQRQVRKWRNQGIQYFFTKKKNNNRYFFIY